MNKFIAKFFIIFVSLISIMFFSLIEFNILQEKRMMKTHPPIQQMQEPPYLGFSAPQAPMQPPHGAPPISIPFFFILGISSIFVYLILRYISSNFIVPFETIKKNVKKIKNGNLDIQFGTKSENDKVNETFNILNEMVDELKIKEKLLDNFIQCLVHDLRAPVIAQERAIEILSDEIKDNELISAMAENNEAYLKMINNIIEAFAQKEIKIEKINFNLSKLIDNVISALEPMAKTKNITLNKKIDENFMIWADFVSINRIVANLITNAIENIDNGKTVTIKAVQNNHNVTLTVEDNGKGIKESEISNLFKKYISKSQGLNKTVSGLGLSIVHELVIKNSGEIKVESKENLYTKFIIELPLKKEV